MTSLRAVLAWTSPVLLVSVAGRVFAGDADAPLLALLVVVAPLIALLGRARGDRPGAAERVAVVGAVGVVLWANLLLIGDLARVLGGPAWHGIAVATALALVATLAPPLERRSTAVVFLGTAGLVVSLAAVGVGTGAGPVGAWAQVASRPAFAFGERSAWVTEGQALAGPTTLSFTEPQRVTALGPGVYRVTGRDGDQVAVREWRLSAGDSLTLRPGDRLALDAGVRLRFEPGQRVPGTAASGAAWAAPRRDGNGGLRMFGVALALVGGAAALVRPRRAVRGAPALLGPGLVLVLGLAASAWGVYALLAAPELSVGAPALAPLVRLPAVVVARPWGGLMIALVAFAVVALWVAAACGLRDRLAAPSDPAGEGDDQERIGALALWAALLVVAAAAAVAWPVEAWRALLAGLGLATSAVVAPGLLPANRRERLTGTLIGLAAFGGLVLGAALLPRWATVLGEAPALVAAPLAAAAVAVARAMRA